MKQAFKRILLAIGTIGAVAMLLALAAPKATHALVAALVQVTNTSSNPVPVTEVGGLQPFQAECFADASGFDTPDCFVSVPPGKRLVLQMVSVFGVVDSGVGVRNADVQYVGGASPHELQFDLAFTTATATRNTFARSQPMTAYVDPDSSLHCVIFESAASNVNFFNCSFVGYLVNE